MKVSECDFCLSESEYLISVNGGLWAICSACNDYVHLQMSIINKEKPIETGKSDRYTIYGEEE